MNFRFALVAKTDFADHHVLGTFRTVQHAIAYSQLLPRQFGRDGQQPYGILDMAAVPGQHPWACLEVIAN